LVNNWWIIEKIMEGIKKLLDLNENENTPIRNSGAQQRQF
jgi:hypothetical protein